MRLLLVLAALALLVPQNAFTQVKFKSNLTHLVESELSRFSARTGVYIKHLETGEETVIRGDEHFNTASVIKIAVMVLA